MRDPTSERVSAAAGLLLLSQHFSKPLSFTFNRRNYRQNVRKERALMNMKHFSLGFCVFLLATASTAAFANDQVTSTVSSSSPAANILNNGVRSGTIQLWYTYVGASLPCGTTPFATFNLGLANTAGTNGKAPTYPVELDLVQSGSGTPVQFTPAPATFSVTGSGWSGSSTNGRSS